MNISSTANMLKIWIFVAIAVVPFIASYPTDDPYRLNAGQHDFALSMLKMLEKNYPGRNHIFSPHSTYRVLLQTYLSLPLSKDTAKSLEHGMSFDEWAESESDVVDALKADSNQKARSILGNGIEFESVDKLYVSGESSLK